MSFIILPIALNVFHGSNAPFGTYSGDNGSPCQELVLFPPEVKRTLPERKWNTPGGLAGSAVVMNMCFDSAGDLSSSAHVPGYGDISNLQIDSTALPQRQRGENSNQLNSIKTHIILKLIVEMHGLEKLTGPQIIEADPD